MTNSLWELFEITLDLQLKRNPDAAVITVEDFIYGYINARPIYERLSLLEKLNKIIERLCKSYVER